LAQKIFHQTTHIEAMSDAKPQTLSRSLALACCELGKFSLKLMTDPVGAVKGVVASDLFQAALLMGSTYYLLHEKRQKHSSRKHSALANDASPRRDTDSKDSSRGHPDCLPTPLVDSAFSLPSIKGKDSDVLVIGVAGGSGSGKTTFARAIYKEFGDDNMAYIMHDNYYRDLSHLPHAQRDLVNFDHPDQLETSLLVEHIRQLKQREEVEIPSYDFAGHVRVQATQRAQPKTLILVEGILIFTNPELFDLLDVKVFIKTDDDVRLIRRMKRDMEERGRTLQGVVDQYLLTVRPMHVKYVEPSMRNADIIVPEGMNDVALDLVVARLHAYLRAKKVR